MHPTRPPLSQPPTISCPSSLWFQLKAVFGLSRIHKIQLSVSSPSPCSPLPPPVAGSGPAKTTLGRGLALLQDECRRRRRRRLSPSFRRDVCQRGDAVKRNYGHEWYRGAFTHTRSLEGRGMKYGARKRGGSVEGQGKQGIGVGG